MCPTAGDRDFSFRDLAEADFDRTPIHYPTGRECLDTTRRLQQVIRFYAARDPQLGREVKDEEGRLLLESNPLREMRCRGDASLASRPFSFRSIPLPDGPTPTGASLEYFPVQVVSGCPPGRHLGRREGP